MEKTEYGKILIRGGLLYDGSGQPPFYGDILIEGDRIAEAAPHVECENAWEIHAEGYLVTPGFIDVHRHCDYAAIADLHFGKLELAQGLTSVYGGNCGLGISPSRLENRRAQYDYVEPCLGKVPSELDYGHFGQYMEALEKAGRPLHVGSYIGTGAVKAAVKGYDKSPFTPRQMEEARALLREGLECGAAGVTMGLMYQPECYSTADEMVTLLQAAAPFSRVLNCHIRGEGDNLVSSVREAADLAERAGLPLNISHFKATGVRNWNSAIFQAIDVIEERRSRGMEITVDFYPYTGGATTLVSLIPLSCMKNTVEETAACLETGEGKAYLKKAIYGEHPGWDNMVTAIGWERILISSVVTPQYRKLCGKSMKDAAAECGYEDPCDLAAELMASEKGKVGILLMSMKESDLEQVMRLPYSALISDALYGNIDCPHPRLYGAFPEFIARYVREKRILPLEAAVAKMTAMPAERVRLKDRGRLKKGYFADINIFRLESIHSPASYERPCQYAEGIAYTFVDGKCVTAPRP